MLRLVSVSLFAGAMLAVTPVAAQEQQPGQQPPPQAAPEQAAPPQAAPPQAAPVQVAPPQAAPEQAAPVQVAPPQVAPEQAAPAQGGATMGNQFCNKDIQPMLARREQIAKSLQSINKRPRPKTFEQAKKTFNDFCGSLSTYIANDQKLLDYMGKNKEFCSISDQNVAQLANDLKQTQSTRTRICSHPPKQQAAPAQKGPAGPAAPKPPVNLRLQ